MGTTDTTNLQAQIDAIDAQLLVIDTEITNINTVIGGLLLKIDTLSESLLGNFTPFNFSSTALTDLTPQMSPVIGNALAIPYAHMIAGMSIRITVWVAMQHNPIQDFRFYLAQDALGNNPYTTLGYEAVPVQITPVNKKYVFTIGVKSLLPDSVFSTTESAYNLISYSPGSLNSFFSEGGMNIFFLAQWRTVQSLQNFTIHNLTVERITGFL